MKYILDESTIPNLKERIMAQSDLKIHQIYPNIIEWNIRDFTVNESIIINYCSDCEPQQSIDDMIKSFKEMKKFAPLVVDKNNYLIDGYHRYLACLQVGIETIPVIRLNVTLGK